MIGPEDAYDSTTKRRYRRRIWNVLESMQVMRSTPKPNRRVLILDEWKAEEATFLVERGYRPENIVVANLSVATAARISGSLRSSGIFGVTAKGGDVGA